MSSLKHLNRLIKLKRQQGKDATRQCDLKLNLLLFTVKKHTKKHPFLATIGTSLTSFLLMRYKSKIKVFYPITSLGFHFFQRKIQERK